MANVSFALIRSTDALSTFARRLSPAMSLLPDVARRAASVLARSAARAASTSASPATVSSSPRFHPEHLAEAPAGFMNVPIALGLAGAVPFVALAVPLAPALGGYVPVSVFPVERRAEAQASYGATIVSFLGGMHWGFAGAGFAGAGAAAGAGASAAVREALVLAGPARFAWSVVPSLLAWPALMCATPYSLVAVAAALAATLAADAGFAAKGLMPRWLMPLRFGLTGVALLGLLSSVPSALEAHEEEKRTAAQVSRLRADAPATRRQLRAREEALADATRNAEAASAASRALRAKLEAREAAFEKKEAELRMAAGARHAEAQVAEARCEALAAETKAAKAQAERFAAEAARAREETRAFEETRANAGNRELSKPGTEAKAKKSENVAANETGGATRREPSAADAADAS